MDFTKLDQFLAAQDKMGIPGCEIHIHYQGETVFRKSYGYTDAARTCPVSNKTAYRLYSMSKLFTAGAAFRLMEAGKLHLEDPVSKYLPAYENLTVATKDGVVPAKNVLTVRHLLSMQGGFDYDLLCPVVRQSIEPYHGHATTRQVIDALAKKPLCFEPGTHFQYSLCHDILGAVIESASGMRFSEYMKQTIWAPLHIEDQMAYHKDRYPHPENVAPLWRYDDDAHTSTPIPDDVPFSDQYENGGGGMIGTNDAYMAYAATVAENGITPDGKTRLFSPETIARWRQDEQTSPACHDDFQRCKPGYGYGLGVRTNIGRGISHIPASEFGWDGAAGSYVMLDTENRLAVVYTQSVHGCGYAFNTIHAAIRDMTYEAIG